VLDVEKSPGRQAGVRLRLQVAGDPEIHYLTLSRRKFGRLELHPGDNLELSGEQNFFGVYINTVKPAHR
jgi:hypothetical protein